MNFLDELRSVVEAGKEGAAYPFFFVWNDPLWQFIIVECLASSTSSPTFFSTTPLNELKHDSALWDTWKALYEVSTFLSRYGGVWWLIGRFIAFRPKGCGIKSCSSRHIGTLGKSFTRNCLWRFGLKLRYSIHAVLEEPLSSSGLEEAL